MTFEEWIKDQPDGYYSNDAIFQAGAASRDAEVTQQSDNYARALAIVNQRDRDIHYLKEECDQLRAQINKLREALLAAESALDESRNYPVTYDEVITALSSTPEQSLAEYRNKVIEECAKQCEAPNEYGFHRTGYESAEAIRTLKEQS